MELTSKDLNKTLWTSPEYAEKHRNWYLLDATNVTLGKLAVEIAKRLMGKHKANYNKFWDGGDFVVLTNCKKIKVTGNKLAQKMYYTHSGYRGHLKEINLASLLEKKPEKVVWYAVRGMLPKNKLRDKRMKRFKIFSENTNSYNNLSLQTITING